MADNTLMDKLSSMPKWILVTGGVLLVSLLGYGMFYFAFGMNKKPDMVDASTITLDMPDAADSGYDKSRLDSYREGDYLANAGRNPVDDYWNSLGGDLVSGGGDLSSPGSDDMSFLNSGEYSEAEKKMILGGVKTREEIDAEHARRRAFEQFSSGGSGSQAGGSAYSRPLTQAQKDSVYNVVAHNAQYPGGDAEFFKFLAENIRYPKLCQEFGFQGRVIMQFVVEKDGSITEISKVRGPGKVLSQVDITSYKTDHPDSKEQLEAGQDLGDLLVEESIRVLKLMPKWKPARNEKDEIVRSRFNVPFQYRLN